MEKIFGLPSTVLEQMTHQFCPGCGHGIVDSLLMHELEEMGVKENTAIVWPVGCSPMAGSVSTINQVSAAHGRAAAVATGLKRSSKDTFVICYQGDGDLAAIGTAETIHAANRGENITVIFGNNSIYGMTGGQMAPTTMLGQLSTTTQSGRNSEQHGNPIRMAEIIAGLEAPKFVARYSVHDAKHVMQTKQGIKKALEVNKNGGYSFIEVVTMCPTGWKMTPEQSVKKIVEENLKVFPLGVLKEVD